MYKETSLLTLLLIMVTVMLNTCVSAPVIPPASVETDMKANNPPPVPKQQPASITDPITGMQFAFVKGGCYQMGDIFGDGSSVEKPAHEVCIDDFAIGKYEVTQSQWEAVMGNNPSYFKRCGGHCPVEQVSWHDIREFIKKLNSQTGKTYRLPTEAEWEYAARSGGKRNKYAGGDDVESFAWFNINSGSQTHPVGQKRPNRLGIYDMSGNVWEWVADWYDVTYYRNSPRENPRGADSGQYRSMRGGSWSDGSRAVRASSRSATAPTKRYSYNGFRLAHSAK